MPGADGIGGSFFHWMIASSSTADERFRRPRERLEDRREVGEEDLNEETDALLFNSAEVIICNVPEMGRLLSPTVSPALIGEVGVPESAALNLWVKIEDCLRW